jgi:hypothetical protein
MTPGDKLYLFIVLATFGIFSAALLHITWIEARAARDAKAASRRSNPARTSYSSVEHA